VTAQDVLFSYEILRDEGLPSFRANLPNTVSGAEVLDDRRIRFDFNPESQVRGRITTAGGLPVFSEASHIASGLDFEDSRLEPLMGSGPYIVGEIDPGRSTVFVRNPDYWGNDLPINRGVTISSPSASNTTPTRSLPSRASPPATTCSGRRIPRRTGPTTTISRGSATAR
jgi:ABC-type oligopeptide transport system substrate-binding subunit